MRPHSGGFSSRAFDVNSRRTPQLHQFALESAVKHFTTTMAAMYDEKDVKQPLLPTSAAAKASKNGKKGKNSIFRRMKKCAPRILGEVAVLCVLAAVWDTARVAVTEKVQVCFY